MLRRLLIAAALAAALPCLAQAQTSPNLTFGQVLTPAQWNALLAGKQDWLGSPPLLVTGGSMTGPLVTAASSATQAGFNLSPGSAPTSPNNGDLWSTPSGLYVRINGATVGPLSASSSGSFTATSPLAVTFPGGGVVNYAFNFSVANTFLAQQTDQGATTTQPGWYAQLAGDTMARARFGLNSADVPSLAFGPGNASRDTFLERAAAATFRLGSPDAASPVAQTLGVQNVVAGTSNTNGANLTINGSIGTGNAAGGDVVIQTAQAGSSGTSQNSLVVQERLCGVGGLVSGAPTGGCEGVGTLNLAASLYNNGTAPTGTGGYVRATSPALVTPTLTLGSDATGDIYYRNSGGLLTRLPIGASGNVLNVSGGIPAWTAPAGGGNVSNSGTPTANQIAQWTNATAVQGVNLASLLTGGGLVGITGTTSPTITVTAAAKTDEQAGTSAVLATTPSQQQQHDSAAKAWVEFGSCTTAGTCTINASYNVSSVTRTSTAGQYQVAFTTPFASANYSCHISVGSNAATGFGGVGFGAAPTASVFQYLSTNGSSGTDFTYEMVVCFGRQ